MEPLCIGWVGKVNVELNWSTLLVTLKKLVYTGCFYCEMICIFS